MREFHSYEGIDPDIHYYTPREELIERAYQSLLGTKPESNGHYITVWGPRQSGKSWVMRQTVRRFKAQNSAETEHPFEVAILSMQSARPESPPTDVLELLVTQLKIGFKRDFPMISDWREVAGLFTAEYFNKPVILILDEFDGMGTEHINHFSTEFRHIYISRRNEVDHPTGQKSYLLHGLALIGVRSVLGIENNSGSPFNVQRSLPIPNLTFEEVDSMFHWYERESDQTVEQAVIDRIFYETQGQPGLVGWLGEILTSETYNQDRTKPITMDHFETVYAAATYDLPNNNILNLISKAKQEPYRDLVLTLFNAEVDIEFSYDDIIINFLYMNGVVERRITDDRRRYVKFSSPFAQKRLFNYFARNLFPQAGQLYVPFTDLSPVITDDSLNVKNLLRLYESYLQKNRDGLLVDAPVRKDLRN